MGHEIWRHKYCVQIWAKIVRALMGSKLKSRTSIFVSLHRFTTVRWKDEIQTFLWITRFFFVAKWRAKNAENDTKLVIFNHL